MSKRVIRKKRHYNPGLSFKQRVHMGMIKNIFGDGKDGRDLTHGSPAALVDKAIESGIVGTITSDEVEALSTAEHIHGEGCKHD
jgi:hypothetical protein